MKIRELREKTDLELERMLVELRDKVRDYRFKITARQLSGVRDVREAKKTIAQVLTLRRERRKA